MSNQHINSSISLTNSSNFQLVSDYYNHFDILNQGSISHVKKYFDQLDNPFTNPFATYTLNNTNSINSISFLIKITFIIIFIFVIMDFIFSNNKIKMES